MYPKSLTDARPGDKLRARGMSREPVGGAMSSIASSALAGQALQQPRGNTRPLLVTGVSSEVFPIDMSRKLLYVVNNDAIGIVFVGVGGQGAALNQGFRLGPNGGFILLDFSCPTERIFMIGTIAANQNVSAVTA